MTFTFDPITLDICWNRLIGVVNEQAAALMRTSFTSIVREAGDLSAGVFGPRGGGGAPRPGGGPPGHKPHGPVPQHRPPPVSPPGPGGGGPRRTPQPREK